MNISASSRLSTLPEYPADTGKHCIGLISNPNSGRNRKHLQKIKTIVANHPAIHHRVTQSSDDIPQALQDFASQSVNVLAINGGDGTVAKIFTYLLSDSPFQTLPLVVLLPGGTTNMNAGDVGLRGNLVKAITNLCTWSDSNDKHIRLLSRPILKVNPGYQTPAVYGMFFGVGAIIQGIEYCHENIHSKGVNSGVGPGLAMARTIWGIVRHDSRFTQPVNAVISLNNQPCEPDLSLQLLLVSSLERLFLGMKPYWGTENGALYFSMIRHGAERFLRTFPSLLSGRPNQHATPKAGYRSHNIDSLTLHMNATFTLDGEMYHADETTGPVRISNGGELRFVQY